jgi:dolichol-phosphate mannosyltransferase
VGWLPPSVGVVIPTYNEADTISGVVGRLLELTCHPSVIVVDDNSPDGTAHVVNRIAQANERVSLVRRPAKQGLGPAYVVGFTWALEHGHDVVVQMDADESHDPADVDRLVAGLEAADLVIGSRYVEGGRIEGWSRRRELLSRAGNRYAATVLPVGVHDLTGGLKAWRAETLAKVDLDAVESRGYAFQIETTVRAAAIGARIVEVPITFRERVAGESKMTGSVVSEALFTVPRLRRLLAR